MRKKLLGLAIAVGVLTMALGGIAFAGEPTRTGFFAAGAFQRSIQGVINVCSDNSQECISEGSVKVKLFKKKDGQWVKIASKPATNENGAWQVSFDNAPRSGRCKMTAIYSGTETYDPSKGSINGGCAEESWM